MFYEYFESYGNAKLEKFEWKKRSKVLEMARKKANLTNNPDYIRPVYVLILLGFIFPILLWSLGSHVQYAATLFIIMSWITSYIANKLAKPYILPFIDESINEYHKK